MRKLVSTIFFIVPALFWADSTALGQTDEKYAEVSVLGPLTTSSNSFGIPQLQSVTLAISEYNYNNSYRHRKVGFKIFDDQSNQERGTEAIGEIERSKSVAAIGPANSSIALSIIEKLREDHSDLPVVSPLATATELTTLPQAWPKFFRANVSDRQRLEKLFSSVFNTNSDPDNVILIYEDRDSYGEGMRDDAQNYLSSKNYPSERVHKFHYSRNIQEGDAARLVNSIAQSHLGSKTDTILIFGITTDALRIIKYINKSKILSYVYFNEPDENEFKAAAEQKLDLQRVRIVSVYYSSDPIVNRFEHSFVARFGLEPSKTAALTYDATNLLLRAIDSAFDGGLNPNTNLSAFREKIVESLNSHEDKGIDFIVPGPHEFDGGEFHNLQFFSLTYDASGKVEPIKLTSEIESKTYKPSTLSIIFSSIWLFSVAGACVIFCSYTGSVTRQIAARTQPQIWRAFFSLTSIIIDPLIAIIAFLSAIIALFVFKQEVFESVKDSIFVIVSAAAVIGGLSGYLGIRLINFFVDRIKGLGASSALGPRGDGTS